MMASAFLVKPQRYAGRSAVYTLSPGCSTHLSAVPTLVVAEEHAAKTIAAAAMKNALMARIEHMSAHWESVRLENLNRARARGRRYCIQGCYLFLHKGKNEQKGKIDSAGTTV